MIVSSYSDCSEPKLRLMEGKRYIYCEIDNTMITILVSEARVLRDALTLVLAEVSDDQR
jgi:hypothetical protein